MRRLACASLTVLALALPAAAEEGAPDSGTSLMEEGAKLLFRGLMKEMEPALDEMERALREMEPSLREMGPRLRQLVDLMGDVTQYEAPERMPNGDILIRRRPGAPPSPPLPGAPAAPPPGEIEL